MQRLHIRLAAVMLLVLVACGPETSWTSRSVGDVVFDHPRAWTVYEGDDTRIEEALVEVVDEDNNGVAVYRHPDETVEDLTETFEQELEAVGGQMVGADPADVSGAPDAVLVQAELDYEEGGESRRYRLSRLLIELGDGVVEVRAREPLTPSDPTLERVLDSVRVPD